MGVPFLLSPFGGSRYWIHYVQNGAKQGKAPGMQGKTLNYCRKSNKNHENNDKIDRKNIFKKILKMQ